MITDIGEIEPQRGAPRQLIAIGRIHPIAGLLAVRALASQLRIGETDIVVEWAQLLAARNVILKEVVRARLAA